MGTPVGVSENGDDEDYEYEYEYTLDGSKATEILFKVMSLMYLERITPQTAFSFFGITLATGDLELFALDEDELTQSQEDRLETLFNQMLQNAVSNFNFQRNLDLPTTVNESPVVAIADSAFWDIGGVKSVNFNRMTYLEDIGAWSFTGNEITSINIDGLDYLVTIGANAFDDNEITNVTLSNLEEFTTVGNSAFANNDIRNVTLVNLERLGNVNSNVFSFNRVQNLTLENVSNPINLINNILRFAHTTLTVRNINQWLSIANYNAIRDLEEAINIVIE